MPFYSGVFFVYECMYNRASETVTLSVIIYIGEAVNCNERIAAHPRYEEWKSFLREGNELCFSTAHVALANLTRVKAALINQYKPLANKDYKAYFPFADTTIQTTGKTTLLESSFVVSRNTGP